MAAIADEPRVARLHLILEARGLRMWYRAQLGPAGSEERHSAEEAGADPLSLAIMQAALEGAREACRGIEAAMQLHLPGIEGDVSDR